MGTDEAMLDFISKDVQDYMKENNIQFTDWEKAVLIYNSDLPVEEMHRRLEKLMESTDDEVVREQVSERLAIEREDLAAFRENTKGYVYAVESYEYENEPYICGYFADAESAYAHGLKQQCKFKIEKHRIVGLDGMKPKISKIYMNPYMARDRESEPVVREYEDDDGHEEAALTYDQEGVLLYYWSDEIERSDEKELELSFNPQRFENAFLSRMPNPFERGDIVRITGDKSHGIVESSQEGWKDFLARVEAGLYVDFIDASITVEFIRENGKISHDHIHPIFLERYEPQKEDDDYELLMAASGIYKEKCSLDWFTECYDNYKKKCKDKKELE